MVQPIKAQKVEELADLLRKAKSVVLNDFTGLNVEDISELRRRCREKGITYLVIKNTLAKRSFQEIGIAEMGDLFEGPTAIAISTDDETTSAQLLKTFAAEYELPRLKGGYISGQIVDEAGIVKLANLPGREVLITQVVGTMQAPLRGLVVCLSATLRDLVGVCKAIAEKKGEAA